MGRSLAPMLSLKGILTVLSHDNQLFLTNIVAQEMQQKHVFEINCISKKKSPTVKFLHEDFMLNKHNVHSVIRHMAGKT